MSAAKDEADDGPDLSGDEGVQEAESQFDVESELSQEDGPPRPKLAKPNGLREDESLAVDDDRPHASGRGVQNLESEDSGSVRAPQQVSGRSSSADGSLSIPDDTPSVQVSIVPLSEAVTLSKNSRNL